MRKIRFALFLGVLCSTLVGCNNGGGGGGSTDHTITFNGTNCFMKDVGGTPITETITVSDGASTKYTIYTEGKQYAVPGQLNVDGNVVFNYTPNTSKTANLTLENIKSDIIITASARDISNICSVTYYSDDHCQWNKDDNPGAVSKGETLVSHLTVQDGTTFTKDNFAVYIEGEFDVLPDSEYSYGNGVFTLKGEAITNNVYIYAHGQTEPTPEDYYDVSFTMSNATFVGPTKELQGVPLEITITASKGYRLPTKDELAPEDVGQQPYDGKIIKIKDGVRHPLRPNQFHYETYIESSTGLSKGYLVIWDVLELWDAKTIEIGGTSMQQVAVTFQVGAGHWVNPASSTEDRVGMIDTGDTLEHALDAASGGETPVIDNPTAQFAGWSDGFKIWNSQEKITDSLTVHATFEPKQFVFYTTDVKNVTITGLPEFVEMNQEVKGVTFTAAENYKLPLDKSKVSVKMLDYETGLWNSLENTQFTYTPDGEKKTASFGINANVIIGDIKITIEAVQEVTVIFDPDVGVWKEQKDSEPIPVTLAAGSTYGDAFGLTGETENPTYASSNFAGWYRDGKTIVTMDQTIPYSKDPIELIAQYTTYVTFSTDTWANVIAHANAGNIKTYYSGSLYIGATRTLNYTDPITNATKVYTVRVIDYDYDYYYDGGNAKASALTFEFTELIGEGEYGSYKPSSATMGTNNWEHSTYRSSLAEFYEHVKTQNTGFEAKKAIKYTLQGRAMDGANDSPDTKVETEENFFPLSGAEINIASKNTIPTTTEYPDDQRLNEAISLNQIAIPYYYYTLTTANRIKALDGKNSEYWLRSPHVYKESKPDPVTYDESECYYILSKDGSPTDYAGIQGSATADNWHGYMAAFCI